MSKKAIQDRVRQAEEALRAAKAMAEKNARFRKLSPAQQRVAIAKDVLEQLADGVYVATSRYFRVFDQAEASGFNASDQVCDIVGEVRCEVCGIGSLLASTTRFVDSLTYGQANNISQKNVHKYLSKYFSPDQLLLIEMWFEANRIDGGNTEPVDGRVAAPPAVHPIQRVKTARRRLTRIMENIVSNNGRFDPTRGAHGEALS